MTKKYILLTASYGNGHNAAKNSIKNHLEEKGHNVIVVDLVDLMIKNGNLTQNFYTFASEKYPIIWTITYQILCTYLINILLKYGLVKLYAEKFNKIVNNFDPDYIISVYPVWQYLIGNYKNHFKKRFKFGVFITDSNLSRPWYYIDRYIDKFYVIDKKIEDNLIKRRKNRKNDIKKTFFPIEEKYFLDKKQINNKKIAILLTGLKEDFCFDFLDKLNKNNFYEEILIIKGRNEELYLQLKEKFNNIKFNFIDFINIKENLKNIDIFIAKPGGALVCECIAQNVFLIAPSYIYGQEKGNIKLLESNKLGFYEKNPVKIIDFLKNGYKKINIKNFSNIKNKYAIKDIIDDLKSIK